MIIFKRPKQESPCTLDEVELRADPGWDAGVDAYIHYFVCFLRALSFLDETIQQGMEEYVEEKESSENA